MLLTGQGMPQPGVAVGSSGLDAAQEWDSDGGWLSELMGSRDVAACVLKIEHSSQLDFRLESVSPAFADTTGLHDTAGRTMRELRPDHEQYWFELFARVARSGEPAGFEHAARACDRRFRGFAIRIGSSARPRVLVLLENCTQADSGEFSLVPPDDGDARLERFGATLAHELRGPLAALCNGLHLVRHSTPVQSNDELRWALSMMERQFARLSSLIDDLLDVGRLGAGNVRIGRDQVNLHQVVSESVEACAAAIDSRHHEVRIESDADDLMVRGDAPRLTQVFTNLVTNSIKYTPPGGHIRIELASVNGMARVEVIDDGIGIAAEDLARVFEYFRQGSAHRFQSQGGLGIGLCIVRSIVRLHGGVVVARSDGPGKGSVFTVCLPLLNLG